VLADALGGNALTAVIGTIRQGDWEQSSTTLKHLTVSRHARNFPLINHSRSRGLMHKLRFRTLSVMVSAQPRPPPPPRTPPPRRASARVPPAHPSHARSPLVQPTTIL
jgi:hypothetical protein